MSNSRFDIYVLTVHGTPDDTDKDRAAEAAVAVLDEAGVAAGDAYSAYAEQWAALDDEEGMTGLPLVWIEACKAANVALTQGWAKPGTAECGISA